MHPDVQSEHSRAREYFFLRGCVLRERGSPRVRFSPRQLRINLRTASAIETLRGRRLGF